jgi:opacity protein-like surface antigen
MRSLFRTLLIGTVLAVGGAAAASAADATDPVVGTWKLNVAQSKFSPGPAPKSQTRSYVATADGIAMTYTGVAADGSAVNGKSTFRYDGKDYPISGSADFDTLSLKRIDATTIESTQKKAGKATGMTVRTVAGDGKILTLKSKGTDAKGKAYDNVMVFDRQ